MQKRWFIFGVVVVIILGAYPLQIRLKQAAFDRVTADMFVSEDSDDFDPGPTVGSTFPGVHARYRSQPIRQISGLSGTNGTILVASRSLDWCPFCMKQMIQLQANKALFDEAGISLVGITYDSPELQQEFIDKFEVTIPLLSDMDTLTFKTLGILNREYSPGDFQYGIPYPGMIVIDPAGKIAGKLFVEAYSSRVDSTAALALAKKMLGIRS